MDYFLCTVNSRWDSLLFTISEVKDLPYLACAVSVGFNPRPILLCISRLRSGKSEHYLYVEISLLFGNKCVSIRTMASTNYLCLIYCILHSKQHRRITLHHPYFPYTHLYHRTDTLASTQHPTIILRFAVYIVRHPHTTIWPTLMSPLTHHTTILYGHPLSLWYTIFCSPIVTV